MRAAAASSWQWPSRSRLFVSRAFASPRSANCSAFAPFLAPSIASAAGWWDRYHDRMDIRHDYADIRHDLWTGHYLDAFRDLGDVQRDRRDLYGDRRGF